MWRIWRLRDGLSSYKSVAKISGIMDLLLLPDQNRIFETFLKKYPVKKKSKNIENNNNNNNNLNWSDDSFLKKL